MSRRCRSIVCSLATLILGPLLAPAIGAQSHSITGSYVATLTTGDVKLTVGPAAARLAGHWSVTFAGDGTYVVRKDGVAHVSGTYTTAGTEVTLTDVKGDFACVGAERAGVYSVTHVKNVITFTKVKDESCPARVAALSSRPFTMSK